MKIKNGLYLKEYDFGLFYIYIVEDRKCYYSIAGSNTGFEYFESVNDYGFSSMDSPSIALKKRHNILITYLGKLK